MNSYKNIARIVGALFIITMIFGATNAYLIDPILFGPLKNLYENKYLLILGAHLMLFMSIGVVCIAVFLYPVVKKFNEAIALTYLSFRIIECVLLIVGVVVSFLLIKLSHESINSVSTGTLFLETLSTLLIKARYYSYQVAMIILGFGSLFLFYIFYRTKIIPTLLSIIGLIGYVMLILSAILDIFGIIDTVNGKGIMMYIPGGIFELILLPAWLIIKGFNQSVLGNKV